MNKIPQSNSAQSKVWLIAGIICGIAYFLLLWLFQWGVAHL